MTPQEHATEAASLAAEAAAYADIDPEMQVTAKAAQVHAVLAGKAGTGTAYASAEAQLAAADNRIAARLYVLDLALAYALMAA